MYDVLPSFVLGFHGCDEVVAEKIFLGKESLRASTNDYDWLGHGIYFWEQNPRRAMEFAQGLAASTKLSQKNKVKKPAVVGAVIDLDRCLNLLDAASLAIVKDGYEQLKKLLAKADAKLPVNKSLHGEQDRLLRRLDCAVVETVHQLRKEQELAPFDSVRGVFVEGEPLYDGAGFAAHTHIQICVRNLRCIKGYFRVLDEPPAA